MTLNPNEISLRDACERHPPPPQPETELHRRTCEARFYLAMPGHERAEVLNRIASKRGDAGAERLADDMRALRAGKVLTP